MPVQTISPYPFILELVVFAKTGIKKPDLKGMS